MIVIIDNERDTVIKLTETFRKKVLNFNHLATSKDGLNFIMSNYRFIDAIFLGIELNDGNGFIICKQIKGNQEFSHIPICLMSLHFDDKKIEAHRKQEEKADYYLKKPFKSSEVETCLQTFKIILELPSEKKASPPPPVVAKAAPAPNANPEIKELQNLITKFRESLNNLENFLKEQA